MKIKFYLTGHQCEAFNFIEGMTPLADFTHAFTKSASPDGTLISEADVIFANLQGLDVGESMRAFTAAIADARKKESELILLADKGQIEHLAADSADVKDIWIMPMSEAETKFRVLRWQQAYSGIVRERGKKEELLLKNRTLESIFKELDYGVLCHTLDGGRIISVNKAAMRVLGYDSQEEMEAEGFAKAGMSVLDEDKERVWKCVSELRNAGDSATVEYRMRHKDGRVRHIMENVKLMQDNGEPFFYRVFLDYTDQKVKEQEQIRHQLEMLQALSIDFNFVCFFDMDTGVGTPIRMHDEDMDYNEEFPLDGGMEFYTQNVVYEEDRERFREMASAQRLEQELEDKRIYYVKYRIMNEGEIMYYQLKAVRVGDWEKNHGILVGFRSVDDETREEIKKKHLLEDALSQSNRASKAKSEFLSNMSHDIRTPMNAIVGFTTLAISHIEQKGMVEEYLKKIMMSSKHLLSLINDILDMSRIESGKMHLEETLCSLTEILDSLKNIMITDAHAKNLELNIDMEDVSDDEIYCDKLRLNQVLLNLLSNSVKYTEAGGAVSLRVIEKPGAPLGSANYEFYVKDTGIGMSAEFVSRIFEPFERERNSTINKIQGSGLGMAITKNIVDMMNGSIEVKSEQGKGTEIIVLLTFRLCSGEKKQIGADLRKCLNTVANVQEAPKDGKKPKGRLLLAEDNELNQEIMLAVLEEVGYLVDVADNGQIAVDMLKKSKPGYYQMILMDVQMPMMNGYEATVTIRGLDDKELASIPIIAMTANAFDEDKRMALSSGMDGHIAKPIDIGNFLYTLEDILHNA